MFDPILSIWESTNFLLVRATVTTRTMEALPIITPSDVRIARSLFARSASIATDIVSRMSIITLCPEFSGGVFRQPPLKLSALLQPFQSFLRHFVLWIQFQCALKFLHCVFHVALVFEEPPEPRACRARSRGSRSPRRFLRAFPQQPLCFLRVFFFQDQRHAPLKRSPQVAGRP